MSGLCSEVGRCVMGVFVYRFDCICIVVDVSGMTAEYLCDTEVNLCYSSPCGGNGTCIRREGGYTCDCYDGYAGRI